MRGLNIDGYALVIGTALLGLAVFEPGCGTSSTTETPADGSLDAGNVDAVTGSDVEARDGTLDSAPALDAGPDATSDGQTPFDGHPAVDGTPGADSSDVANPPRDAGPCTPLTACSCGADAAACAGTGTCIPTVCGSGGGSCACSAPPAICIDPGNGTCSCGVALVDNCVKPASHCLCTSCADGPGAICVTDAQQSDLCSGPFRPAFACP